MHPEVLDLLIRLADAAVAVARPKRTFFVNNLDSMSGLMVVPPEASHHIEVAEEDLQTLADSGYIRATRFSTTGSFEFTVTESGLRNAEEARGAADTFEGVEAMMLRGLDDQAFRNHHPDAYAKWQHAARLAAEDPIVHATRIGHDCREAMQLFATSVVDKTGVAVDARPTDTVKKLRTVLAARKESDPERVSDFLDALLVFWGTVSDLAQRQEHGAQKEGEALTAADGTRLALQTAVVMFEIDRTLVTP